MKIAAISDIHGNLNALQAVLAEMDREDVDHNINCGDTLNGPLAIAKFARPATSIPRITLGWQVQLRSVAYDFEPMAQLAERRGRADWVLPLRTGRMS